MSESVDISIPPSGESLGRSKLLMVTPGRPLKAFRVTSLLSWTLSKMVPMASTLSLSVCIVHVKLGLCRMKVA